MPRKIQPRDIATDPLLTGNEVAQRLGMSPGTLTNWRSVGIGPAYIKMGRNVRYRSSRVNEWVEQQERTGSARRLG